MTTPGVQTYAVLLAASSIVPAYWRKATPAGLGHGVVVIEIDAIAFVGETVLAGIASQVLDDGLRIRQRFVDVLERGSGQYGSSEQGRMSCVLIVVCSNG
jgi:hypothetical protein